MKLLDNNKLLNLNEAKYRKFLPLYLQKQVSDLMQLYREYNPLLHTMYRHKDIDFNIHEKFYLSFLVDRNRRAQEISTKEYTQIASFGESLLPMDTYEILCMDGRVKLIHTNGFSAEIGSSTRTAGGLFEGFRVDDDGVLELKADSQFARILIKLLRKDRAKSIAEVIDSHWACAKRLGEEGATGNINMSDSGLYRDVQVKQQMAQAIRTFLNERAEFAQRNVALIQTTFNPITGFLYMGLETKKALTYAENISVQKAKNEKRDLTEAIRYTEFGKDVIKRLIEENKIISTGSLISDPLIKNALESHKFDIDWQHKYLYSAKNYWENIAKLKKELLPTLLNKVCNVYPHLKKNNTSNQEAEERAMLLLTNTYNTYLHNSHHDESEYLNMNDEDYEEEEHYPYGIHNEEGVKVSEGGHPPYNITMFVVTPGDPESIETAAEIVRTNRRRKRIKNDEVFGYYSNDIDAFTKSPVPVVVQEIARETNRVKISSKEWDTLRKADWSDMPADWDTMSKEDFDSYILEKGIDSHLIVEHIHALREKMISHYFHPKLGPHARQLFKTFMPGICNQKREFQAIIPFIKVGRAMKKKSHKHNKS